MKFKKYYYPNEADSVIGIETCPFYKKGFGPANPNEADSVIGIETYMVYQDNQYFESKWSRQRYRYWDVFKPLGRIFSSFYPNEADSVIGIETIKFRTLITSVFNPNEADSVIGIETLYLQWVNLWSYPNEADSVIGIETKNIPINLFLFIQMKHTAL